MAEARNALKNAPCCPIAVVGCYSGSSQDDHNVSTPTILSSENTVEHFLEAGCNGSARLPQEDRTGGSPTSTTILRDDKHGHEYGN